MIQRPAIEPELVVFVHKDYQLLVETCQIRGPQEPTMKMRQRAVRHPALQTRVPVVLRKLTLDGRLMHHASKCKRLVVEVGYVIGYIRTGCRQASGNLQPQSDGLSSIFLARWS